MNYLSYRMLESKSTDNSNINDTNLTEFKFGDYKPLEQKFCNIKVTTEDKYNDKICYTHSNINTDISDKEIYVLDTIDSNII